MKIQNRIIIVSLVSVMLNCLNAQERLVVEVDIFSGTPNPLFPLEITFPTKARTDSSNNSIEQDEKHILDLIKNSCTGKNLTTSTKKPPIPQWLGYQGVCILRQTGQETYQPVAMIYRKTIRLSKQNGHLLCGDGLKLTQEDFFYNDENSELEKALIRLAIKKKTLTEKAFTILASRRISWAAEIQRESGEGLK